MSSPTADFHRIPPFQLAKNLYLRRTGRPQNPQPLPPPVDRDPNPRLQSSFLWTRLCVRRIPVGLCHFHSVNNSSLVVAAVLMLNRQKIPRSMEQRRSMPGFHSPFVYSQPFFAISILNPNYDVINDVISGFAIVVLERCGFYHWIARRISWGEVISVFLYLL